MQRDWWLYVTGSDIFTYLIWIKFLQIENCAQFIHFLSDMQATDSICKWITAYEYQPGYYRRGRVSGHVVCSCGDVCHEWIFWRYHSLFSPKVFLSEVRVSDNQAKSSSSLVKKSWTNLTFRFSGSKKQFYFNTGCSNTFLRVLHRGSLFVPVLYLNCTALSQSSLRMPRHD